MTAVDGAGSPAEQLPSWPWCCRTLFRRGVLDPYLVWAWLTHFKGFGHKRVCDRIAFIVEVAQATDVEALAKKLAPTHAEGQPEALALVPASYYKDARGAAAPRTRFCTARVRLRDVPHFLSLPYIVRAELGQPGVESDLANEALSRLNLPDLALSVRTEVALPVHTDVALPVHVPPWSSTAPVIGLIDHGIGFLNRNLLIDVTFRSTPSGPPMSLRLRRVVRVWDQWHGEHAPKHAKWDDEKHFGYGRRLEYPQLQALCLSDDDEAAKYRALGYDTVAGRASHGTHVMSVAAGNVDPLLAQEASLRDIASLLPIVAVQLPWKPEKDVSGASLCVNVLDGLRFIVDSAAPADADSPTRNLVVNLSDGAMAGSHTGTSILEQAIDELLLNRPGLSLVLAAGNAYRESAHAAGVLDARAEAVLHWQVLPDDRTESFVEIWLPEPGEVSLSVEAPGGLRLGVSRRRRIDQWPKKTPGEVMAAALYFPKVPNGAGQLILLALRPTRLRASDETAAPHGIWTLTVKNQETAHRMPFHAWVERDDPPFADHGPRRQSRFVDDGAGWLTRRDTLNSIATGEGPIVVGGYRASDKALARYSAAGSQRDLGKRPTVVAPSDECRTLPGIRASGSLSGATVRMNGTSVAAPVVTRIIANTLAKHHDRLVPAQEMKDALRSNALPFTPPYDADDQDARNDEAQRIGSGWIEPGLKITLS